MADFAEEILKLFPRSFPSVLDAAEQDLNRNFRIIENGMRHRTVDQPPSFSTSRSPGSLCVTIRGRSKETKSLMFGMTRDRKLKAVEYSEPPLTAESLEQMHRDFQDSLRRARDESNSGTPSFGDRSDGQILRMFFDGEDVPSEHSGRLKELLKDATHVELAVDSIVRRTVDFLTASLAPDRVGS